MKGLPYWFFQIKLSRFYLVVCVRFIIFMFVILSEPNYIRI